MTLLYMDSSVCVTRICTYGGRRCSEIRHVRSGSASLLFVGVRLRGPVPIETPHLACHSSKNFSTVICILFFALDVGGIRKDRKPSSYDCAIRPPSANVSRDPSHIALIDLNKSSCHLFSCEIIWGPFGITYQVSPQDSH